MNVFKKQRVRAQIMNIYYVYFNTFDASKICMYRHAQKIFARGEDDRSDLVLL